jgi:hypothetical protein
MYFEDCDYSLTSRTEGDECMAPRAIDVHCHVLGNGKNLNNAGDVFYNVDDNPMGGNSFLKKLFIKAIVAKQVESFIRKEGGVFSGHEIAAAKYFDLVFTLLAGSSDIDGVVLLAMDKIYDPCDGRVLERETELWVPNGFLYRMVNELNEKFRNADDERIRTKRFYFGASVSPNNPSWEAELLDVCTHTDAVLLKWIPSAMHIHVDDQRHREFYQALREYDLPLLCHSGPEYAFFEGAAQAPLDNYKHLAVPLSYGVKVINAHCAAPLFPGAQDEMDAFVDFITAYNTGGSTKLWADTSALSLGTRACYLPTIVRRLKPEWLVHGSDFPVPISATEHLPYLTYDMTVEEYGRLLSIKNPFDLDVRIKEAHGFNSAILRNAQNILRMPA